MASSVGGRAKKAAYMREYMRRRKAEDPAWHEEYKRKQREYNKTYSYRRYHLQRNYGLSPEEFDQLLQKQQGVCAICRSKPTPSKDTERRAQMYVDHDHQTGQVRGILCRACNSGIGGLRDDVKLLRRAIQYLESPPVER